MAATRRTAKAALIKKDTTLSIADAMVVPFRPSNFVVDDNDPLDDSIEHLWPGVAAQAAARRAAAIIDFPVKPSPRTVKASSPRTVKARAASPRKRTTKASTPAPVFSPAPAPVQPALTRAPLGVRRQEAAPLPSAAKKRIEGSQIPSSLTGTITIVGSFKASTGDTLILKLESSDSIAEGIVVWSGPLQERVRKAANSGQVVQVTIRRPSNPRFKPSVADITPA